MLPTSVPEIQRTNLATTVLILKAMGINDLIHFDFMDPPPVQTLIAAMEQLYTLSALDDEGLLTKLGRMMAEFPIEPQLSKMLLTAADLGCADEILSITAMLQVQNVFYRPRDKQTQADQRKSKFNHAEGDHLTLLAVFEAWQAQDCSTTWCFDNFVQSRSLKRALDTKNQLIQIMQRLKIPIDDELSRKAANKRKGAFAVRRKEHNAIRKAIAAGFFNHACRKDPQEGYRSISDN